MKTVLKICCESWENASRDKRELSVARDLGFNPMVMCKGNDGKIVEIDGFEAHTFSTRPLGDGIIARPLNHLVTIIDWSKKVKQFQPDIISGHNYPGVLIGYLYSLTIPKKNRPFLIYDSHEFELGRNKKRNRFRLALVKLIEGFLIGKCAFTIVVNDSIADELVKIYKLSERPLVIRSTPNKWTIDEKICKETRMKLTTESGVEDKFTLMYHGGILKERGIETLISVLQSFENIRAVILGNGDEQYISELKQSVKEKRISDRVIFHEAVPVSELWKYVGAADVGMILAPATCKNHLYSLPNKFFENIQSETPIICPNYPAMSNIMKEYEIGLMCNPEDINSVCECIHEMQANKKLYSLFKKNIKIAKSDLCWENEKNKLTEQYSRLL